MTELLRWLILIALAVVVAAGGWMFAREPLSRWARDTKGEPWFAPMPIGFGLMPVTWQGWLLMLAILIFTCVLGLLGAAGVFGPGRHFGG